MQQPSDTPMYTVSVFDPSSGNKNNISPYYLVCKLWTMRVILQNSCIQSVSAGLKKDTSFVHSTDEKGMLCPLNPQLYLQEQLFISDSV